MDVSAMNGSGVGGDELDLAGATDPTEARCLVEVAVAALATHGVAVMRGARLDRSTLSAVMSAIAHAQFDSAADLLVSGAGDTSAQPQPSPAIGAIPLHRDSELMGAAEDLIAYHAIAADDSAPTAGALELVDTVAALTEFDPALLDQLRSTSLEYRILLNGPYETVPQGAGSRGRRSSTLRVVAR